MLAAWSLEQDHLHAIVSDTVANMKSGLQSLNWIECFLRLLNLVVKHAVFKQVGVESLIKKVKTLIKKLRTPTG